MEKLFVGIDILKDKFDVSYTKDGQNTFGHSTFLNSKSGIKKFFSKAIKILEKENLKQLHFCMEATGIYHCELCEFLQESPVHIVSVINPLKTKAFSRSLLLRTKNDKVDSSMLALYGFLHNPPQTPRLPETIKRFRNLVRYKETLTESRTQEIGRLKSSLDSEVKKLINKKILFIEKQTKEVISKIQDLVNTNEFLKKQISLLKTVDGIGDVVAWKLLSEIKFEDIENISPKAQVAHAGLSPREFSSGVSVRGRSHISRMGNSDLRKILLTAMGVLRNQQPFDPYWAEKAREQYINRLNIA